MTTPDELVAALARRLVDSPEEVRVERSTREDGATVLRLRVAPEDVGKVIGRGGRLVRSLRTLLRAAGGHAGERLVLEIVEE